MKKKAIFDVCGTLYHSNTTFDFINYHHKKLGNKGWRLVISILRTLPLKVVNHFAIKFFKFDLVKKIIVYSLVGTSKSELESSASSFVSEFLSFKKISHIHSLLNEFKRAGYEVVLLSATIDVVANAINEELNSDYYISSELEFSSLSMCTGYLLNDIYGCKLDVFNEEMDFFVTDNLNDIDLIKLANTFLIVSNSNNLDFWRERFGSNAPIYIVEKNNV